MYRLFNYLWIRFWDFDHGSIHLPQQKSMYQVSTQQLSFLPRWDMLLGFEGTLCIDASDKDSPQFLKSHIVHGVGQDCWSREGAKKPATGVCLQEDETAAGGFLDPEKLMFTFSTPDIPQCFLSHQRFSTWVQQPLWFLQWLSFKLLVLLVVLAPSKLPFC